MLRLVRAIGRLDELIVLRTQDDRIDTHGMVVLIILYRHLTLSIRSQVRHQLRLMLAYLSQLEEQRIREVERSRQIVGRLGRCLAKHHALVASSLLLRVGTVHTTVDVVTLIVDSTQYATATSVKAVLRLVVPDTIYHTPHGRI